MLHLKRRDRPRVLAEIRSGGTIASAARKLGVTVWRINAECRGDAAFASAVSEAYASTGRAQGRPSAAKVAEGVASEPLNMSFDSWPSLDQIINEACRRTIEACKGNKTAAARVLRCTRNTLRSRQG